MMIARRCWRRFYGVGTAASWTCGVKSPPPPRVDVPPPSPPKICSRPQSPSGKLGAVPKRVEKDVAFKSIAVVRHGDVSDVNGWSFVKKSRKDDCAALLAHPSIVQIHRDRCKTPRRR